MVSSVEFQDVLSLVPVDKEELVAMGVGAFVSRYSPKEVKMAKYDDGFAIKVFTDEASIRQAMDHWDEHIEPHLEEED